MRIRWIEPRRFLLALNWIIASHRNPYYIRIRFFFCLRSKRLEFDNFLKVKYFHSIESGKCQTASANSTRTQINSCTRTLERWYKMEWRKKKKWKRRVLRLGRGDMAWCVGMSYELRRTCATFKVSNKVYLNGTKQKTKYLCHRNSVENRISKKYAPCATMTGWLQSIFWSSKKGAVNAVQDQKPDISCEKTVLKIRNLSQAHIRDEAAHAMKF